MMIIKINIFGYEWDMDMGCWEGELFIKGDNNY